MTQATCVDGLPELTREHVRLREVQPSDAPGLVALFSQPEVSAHLSPPPANVEEFTTWIDLSRTRRSEGRAACYTLLTAPDAVSGLFMALRLETEGHAEIGFAMAPALWGTGTFETTARLYISFLFDRWNVTTLVGRTLEKNVRGVGAMRKLGATIVDRTDRNGNAELVWTVTSDQWRAPRP